MNPIWASIDSVYTGLAGSAPPDRSWLLQQTLATAGSRRALLGTIPVQPGWRALDVGCGFGMTSAELAGLGLASVVGVDLDRPVLEVAARAVDSLDLGGASVSFLAGDAYRLPMPGASADLVLTRFVFQHLSDPAAAAAEIGRVLRPGGLVCAVDVDDGLSISEPPPSEAFERLATGLRAAQAGYGGDRRIGRRLPAILDAHHLNPVTVLVLPQAAYHRPSPDGQERALLVKRFEAARAGIVAGGHMSAAQFDSDLRTLAAEAAGPTCEVEAHLAVIARKA